MTDRVPCRVHRGLVPLLLAAAAASAGCFADIFGSDHSPATAEERFEYGIELAREVRLVVSGKSGDITVRGVPGSDSVVIRSVLRVTADNPDDAEAGLAEFWVDVDLSTTQIIVQTAQPSTLDTREFVADYEISVPLLMNLNIANVVGDITVSDVGGTVSIVSASGNVWLLDTFGDARVDIGNGSVDARVTMYLGATLSISTGNGNIDLDVPIWTSAYILASAANGMVSVSNLDIDYQFRTENAIAGTLKEGLGSIRLASGNGSVSLLGY